MAIFKKLEANSLAITVVIALVIGLLCSSVILLAYYNRRWDSFYNYEQKLSRNLSSAINVLLADTTDTNKADADIIDLFRKGNDSIIIKKNYWGLFNIASVSAICDQRSQEKLFYYGASLPSFMDGCIYMADHDRPLQITGTTILEGDAIISKAGLKAGYINQAGFSGIKLINGAVKASTDSMPPVSAKRIDYLQQLIAACKTETRVSYEDTGDSISHSFKDSTLLVTAYGELIVTEKALKGNIILMCDSSIAIEANAKLKNIIVVAPIIKIKEGFRGSIQAIASRQIEVENNCQLGYPSALVLLKDTTQTDPPSLTIGESSLLQGVLFTWSLPQDTRKTMVTLQKNSLVQGVAYISGYAVVKGSVHGTIATDYFLHRSDAMLYENYLVDIEVNRKKLFPFFVSSPLFTGYKNNKVVQWVN